MGKTVLEPSTFMRPFSPSMAVAGVMDIQRTVVKNTRNIKTLLIFLPPFSRLVLRFD
jgi:hypothetical protein